MLVERKKEFTRLSGLGPWTQLGDDRARLQLLNQLDRWDEVLAEVAVLRTRMDALPESGTTGAEATTPWAVRESLLDTDRHAALMLKQYQNCLEFIEAIAASKLARGAPTLDLAQTRFNAYFPLPALGRLDQATALLHHCRRTFEEENDIDYLGKLFSGFADLSGRCCHFLQAVAHEKTALRYTYSSGDPGAVAISHFNLANHLSRTAAPARAIFAHRLAATLIFLQTGDGKLAQFVAALARDRARYPSAQPPATFAAVCAEVDQVEGVHFAQLFARLPASSGSGDQALAHVLTLATRSPDEA